MTNRIVEVGLKISGDASGARKAAADTASDLTALAEDAAKVKILDTAVASVERFDSAVQSSQAKVRVLRETLSEAYAAGADAPMIRKLEKDLAAVERQAQQAAGALQQAQATVGELNLRFADAGISTANLADKKAELIQRSQAVAQAAQEEAEFQRYLANETERAAKAAAQLAADTKFEAQRQAAIEYQKSAEYAGWWADSLDKVEQAQADLDAAQDLDRQRQANIQTQKSAEYAEWWAQQLAQVDRAAQVAGASTTRLNRAFNTLNIRSADQIDAEILEINQALQALAKRADLTGAEFDRAFGAAQQRLHALKQEAAGGGEALDDVGKRAGNASALLGKLGLAFGGLELARQFVAVNAELENVKRNFLAITGSVEQAATEMDYARNVATRLGIEQLSTAKSYASLIAATKGTSAEGEKTRQVFEAVTRAMSLAGKSSVDTEGALLALQQMANKGVVAMEELRGQLSERLPGALNATAEGLGITTAQLIKLVETGQMTADELFPALAAGLNKLYKDASTETLSQEWQHFKTAVQDAYEQIGDAGVVDALKTALEGMEAVVFGVSTGMVALGKNIGVLTAALANGDIGVNGFSENAKKAFAEIEEEVRQRTVRIAQQNTLVAAGLDETGKKMLEASRQQGQARKSEADTSAELAQKTKLAAEAELGLSERSKALINDFAELTKKGGPATDMLEKLAKSLDLSDVRGIADAGAALDALAVRGKISAEQVRQAWQQALDGKDLRLFEANARSAFDSSEQGARRLAAALDAQLGEALHRTGLDAGALSAGINEAAQTAINDFDVLLGRLDDMKSRGVDTGIALAASLDQAGKAATTEAAVQAVIDRWKELGDAGLMTGEKLTEGLERAQKKLDDLKPGINSLAEAFRTLGMKTPAELKKTAEAAEAAFNTIKNSGDYSATGVNNAREAFKRYAEAAIAANGGVASEMIKAQAWVNGFSIEVDNSGKAMVKAAGSASAMSGGVESVADQVRDAGDAAAEATDQFNGLSSAMNKAATTPNASGVRGPYGSGNVGSGSQGYSSSGDSSYVIFNARDEAIKAGATVDNVEELTRLIQFEIEKATVFNGGQFPSERERDTAAARAVQALTRPAENRAAAQPTAIAPAKLVQIDLRGAGGKRSTVYADDRRAAEGLIKMLEESARSSI